MTVTAMLALSALTVAADLTGCAPVTSKFPGSVTIFAAASLKTPFTKIAAEFEEVYPGIKVTLNFAGSADLVTQITQGAPADVFASADAKNMTKLFDAKLVSEAPSNFATNVLEIAVPPANPAGVRTFADLARQGVKVVVCAPQVPCEAATAIIEHVAGVILTPVSEESSVTDVLSKVISQGADAGLVYVTDVKTAGAQVQGIPFAESDNAVNTYPIATVGTNKNKELAKAFIAMVMGSEGRKVLSDAGFGTP